MYHHPVGSIVDMVLMGIKTRILHRKDTSLHSSSTVSVSTGVVCNVSSCCLDSDIDTKQKLSLQFWNHEDNFSIEQPIIEGEEFCTECEFPPLNSTPKPDSEQNRTKLHFLEERDEKVLSKRLITLSRSNKTRSAFELFLSMEASSLRPDSHACNSLLSCLLRNGPLQDALKVFDTMVNSELATAHTYTILLKNLSRIEGCDKTLSLFHKLEGEEIHTRNFDIIVYNTAISISNRAKNWVETDKIWRKLTKNSLKGDLLTYDLLISTFVQCGCAELALEAYHELVRVELVPNEGILKAVISICTREENSDLSLYLLTKMINLGIKPSLITFNSVINCLGKSGLAELAFRVYKILKLCNLEPDVYTINSLLSALYRSRKYYDAIRLFQGVKKEGKVELNLHIYNTVLMVLRKLGYWERPLQLLWEMERTGMQVRTESYNHVIFACEIGCKPRVALRVYRHMVRRGCERDNFTFLPLIRCCLSGAFSTELDKILEDIAMDISVYNTIIHELCSQDKIELGKMIHVKMLKIGIDPDEKTMDLICTHFRNNYWE